VEIREVELRRPRDDEVVVQVSHSGISGGTELLVYRGEVPADLPMDGTLDTLGGTFSYPFPYGYSCVGRVEGTGDTVFVFHPHQDLVVVRPEALIPLPAVPPRDATLFPLVETALQVTLDAGQRLGEPVALLGLGVLGTLTALLLERAGARPVCAEPDPWRRRLAGSLGLRAVDPERLRDEIGEETGGRGVSLAIDASGHPDAPGQALGLLAHEGTLLVASWLGTKLAPLPLGLEFHRRRLTIRSTQVSTIPSALAGTWTLARRRRAAAELLGQLPLAALASHELPLERAADAFAALDRAEEGLMHVALSYQRPDHGRPDHGRPDHGRPDHGRPDNGRLAR
jgi:2-desacetyl-2-hydroxyethyl bacteriochlorophyllide A dehydrogenase